jgi:nicotinate-nucleotide adenylyltransferase
MGISYARVAKCRLSAAKVARWSQGRMSRQKARRIGIYAGTFDPVHVGHITFALQAIEEAKLDQVVFLPERVPRHKIGSEHYGHRVAMLKGATAPHPNLAVLELTEKNFTIARTWPHLQTIFEGTELSILVGTDVLAHMQQWPAIGKLLSGCEIIVGTRADDKPGMAELVVRSWPQAPKGLHIVRSYSPDVSSTNIRQAIGKRTHTQGLLASVHRYAMANWLYVSIEHALNKTSR